MCWIYACLTYLSYIQIHSPSLGLLQFLLYFVLHYPHLLGQSWKEEKEVENFLIHSFDDKNNAIWKIETNKKKLFTSLPAAVYVFPSKSRLSSSSSSDDPSDSDLKRLSFKLFKACIMMCACVKSCKKRFTDLYPVLEYDHHNSLYHWNLFPIH